jgi:hypothetical protein
LSCWRCPITWSWDAFDAIALLIWLLLLAICKGHSFHSCICS